jgi:hypothetical protein
MYRLPDKKDFIAGGKFSHLQIKRNNLPVELMSFIFPDYTEILFKQKPAPNKKTMKIVYEYCISLKKSVLKDQKEQKKREKKEMEVKILEENIRLYFDNYYKNLYKDCNCIPNANKN